MTGEITLRGNVLPIGGLKEKMLAARRAGITIDRRARSSTRRSWTRSPRHLKRGLEIHLVDEVDEVLRLALIPPLEPRAIGAGPKSPPRTFPGKPRVKPVTV